MSHHFLSFTGVNYSYPSGLHAVRDLTLNIPHGSRVALLGANGAGKSTLLLLAAGLLTPSSGEISVGGVPISPRTMSLVRATVGFVFQNPDDQLFMPTVRDDVAFGPVNMGLSDAEVARRVEEALTRVGALHLADRSADTLSAGQKHSAAMATVLSMEPSILLMDEPSAGLDPRARRRLIQILGEFSHTCLMATHDIEMARELCPQAIVMCDGRVVAEGLTSDILLDAPLLESAGL